MPFTCTFCTYFTTERFEDMLKHKKSCHSEDGVAKPVVCKRRSLGFEDNEEIVNMVGRKNRSFEHRQVVGKTSTRNSPMNRESKTNCEDVKHVDETKLNSLHNSSQDDSAFFSSPDQSHQLSSSPSFFDEKSQHQNCLIKIQQRPAATSTSITVKQIKQSGLGQRVTYSTPTTASKIQQESEKIGWNWRQLTSIAKERPITSSTPTTRYQIKQEDGSTPIAIKRPVASSTPTAEHKLNQSPVVRRPTEQDTQFYLGSYIINVFKSKPKNYKKIVVDPRKVASGCTFCKNAATGDVCQPQEEIVLVHERVRGCLRVQNKSGKFNSDCPICIFIIDDMKSVVPRNQKQIHEEMTW